MSLLRHPDSAGHYADGDGGDAGKEIGAEGVKSPTGHIRGPSNTPHIPEELSTGLIDWSSFVFMGNTMPPRDPEEDEDEDEEEDDEEAEEEEEDDEKRTAPTNRRSCASRTKTKQNAFGIGLA